MNSTLKLLNEPENFSIDAESMIAKQLEGVRWTIEHAQGSEQYRKKLHGINPQDIKTLDDLRKLPMTDTTDLREGYPLPLLSVPEQDVVRIHASSGTTGKRKILAYSQKDIETFNLQMARCYELAGVGPNDRMQIAVGYGLWTAGAGFQLGSEAVKALTIPVGPGNIEMHLQLLQDLQVTCFGATASMALLLAEEVERQNLRSKLALKKVICGAEMRSEKMRQSIEEKLGLENSYDIAGMTEMYGPGTAIECGAHNGLHYWPDIFLIEIINPETLEPVQDGEVGEMVVTSLRKEATPLIRYRTRDLSRMITGKCSCGLHIPRHDKIVGRSDDMIIFRGVNIYPGQLSHVIEQFKELGGEYHVELRRDDKSLDHMSITLERRQGEGNSNDEALAAAVGRRMHKSLMARVDVKIADAGSLPRSFGKSKRVTDLR